MGQFEIKRTSDGEYHFVLKAGNGEIIAQSEKYTSKEAAKKGIESVRKNAATAELIDHCTSE